MKILKISHAVFCAITFLFIVGSVLSAQEAADQPLGWNDGKRGIARDLLDAFDGDTGALDAVADAAIFSILAWASYDDPQANFALAEAGWSRLKAFSEERAIVGDLNASLFKGPDGQHVLAFRGSVTGGDWITNVAGTLSPTPLLNGQVEDALRVAEAAVQQYPNVVFTGHSLGGRLAQAASIKTGNLAYAFNSAPVGFNEIRQMGYSDLVSGEMRRFRSPQDQLSGVFTPSDVVVANIPVIEANALFNLVNAQDYTHAMGVLAQAMENVRSARDLGWIAAYLNEPNQEPLAAGDTAEILSEDVPLLTGIYVNDPTACQSPTVTTDLNDSPYLLSSNNIETGEALCSVRSVSTQGDQKELRVSCNIHGNVSDANWFWNIIGRDRFETSYGGLKEAWARCEPNSPLAKFHSEELANDSIGQTSGQMAASDELSAPGCQVASAAIDEAGILDAINGKTVYGLMPDTDTLWRWRFEALDSAGGGVSRFTASGRTDSLTTLIDEGRVCENMGDGTFECNTVHQCESGEVALLFQSGAGDWTYAVALYENAENRWDWQHSIEDVVASTPTSKPAQVEMSASPVERALEIMFELTNLQRPAPPRADTPAFTGEEALDRFIAQALPDYLVPADIRFKAFGENGEGRFSVAGHLIVQNDLVAPQPTHDVLMAVLQNTGLRWGVIEAAIARNFQNDLQEYHIVHPAGSLIDFTAELPFTDTVDGLRISGTLNYALRSTQAIDDVEGPNAFTPGTRDFLDIADRVALFARSLQDSADPLVLQFIQNYASRAMWAVTGDGSSGFSIAPSQLGLGYEPNYGYGDMSGKIQHKGLLFSFMAPATVIGELNLGGTQFSEGDGVMLELLFGIDPDDPTFKATTLGISYMAPGEGMARLMKPAFLDEESGIYAWGPFGRSRWWIGAY
ncbi:hypothetical protein [Sedimentitalea arenosa]|uniref:DUF2974 domain-containing protein n=1 Tax=Sedimentitalea arenosa TaxID=2798803 RepID=A0A8J7J8J9_9RHOB|nr:hypothetical protein [Arenibacterium arenosum]MBJ6370769.1 hypothetical protein [Arenibacterium arenosum]